MLNKTKWNKLEGYKGGWSEGYVKILRKGFCYIYLKKLSDCKEKSLVKVKRFIRGNGKLLLEVSFDNVRPIPPYRQFPQHSLDGLAVEVKEMDSWWPGFIVRQIELDNNQLWLVSFPHTKVLTAYPMSYLRPAQEWKGGQWTLVP